jgi:hypothetical protein
LDVHRKTEGHPQLVTGRTTSALISCRPLSLCVPSQHTRAWRPFCLLYGGVSGLGLNWNAGCEVREVANLQVRSLCLPSEARLPQSGQ